MSGPKGYSYEVARQRREEERRRRAEQERRRREEEERRRREEEERKRQAMKQKCFALEKKIENVLSKLTKQGLIAVPKSAGETLSAFEKWERELKKTLAEAQQLLRAQHEEMIMEFVGSHGKELDLSGVSLASRSVGKWVDRELLRKQVHAVAEALSKLENEALRDALLDKLSAISKKDDADEIASSMADVKNMAFYALREQEYKELAEQLVSDYVIDYPDDGNAGRLYEIANSVFSEDGFQMLNTEINKLREEHQKIDDAEYVQAALQEILVEMGYEVGGEFEVTDFGNVSYVGTTHDDYLLRIQVQPEKQMIFTRLVAVGETTPEQDKEAEQELCSSIHSTMDRLGSVGISTNLVSERKSGECKMDRIAPATQKRRKRKNVARKAQGRGRAR